MHFCTGFCAGGRAISRNREQGKGERQYRIREVVNVRIGETALAKNPILYVD